MYERTLNGTVLSFGHEGILYENSFVMYDRQTESLWVHVTGRAEIGPLKGEQLTFMPSTLTSWSQWKRSHPNTLVLPGFGTRGFMGTYRGLGGSRRIGLAVVVRFEGKLYPFRVLEERNVVNDRFNGEELLVYYSRGSGTATAWSRTLDGRVLTFRSEGSGDDGEGLRDEQTGSRWSWLTGEAVEGELRGRELKQLRYNPIRNDRFRVFYPEGPVYGLAAE